MTDPAMKLAMIAAGVFFLTGLLTGIWKYLCIEASEKAEAPYYVNIAHRAALMYAFASLLLAEFARLSAWSDGVNFLAVLGPVVFFASAIFGYLVHGLLRDTDNQLHKPHRLGAGEVHPKTVKAYMWALIVAEIGGFLVLLAGMVAGF